MVHNEYTSQNLNNFINKPTGVVDGEISLPLVITLENKQYHGFVPGIVMNDIVDDDIEKCLSNLKEHTKQYVLKKIENKDSFPFFPTNDEIKKDFKNVVKIKRIKAKINY